MSDSLLQALEGADPMLLVELRPPRAGLDSTESMDAWIDRHHAVTRLHRADRYVLLTDDAVGQQEEENLAHIEGNLPDASEGRSPIPFLTCKHPLEYCLVYAERAWARGLRAITVVGGDPQGPPRCVPHAADLRALIRERVPGLRLGGWVNPHRDPREQVAFLAEAAECTDFYLTQVASEYSTDRVDRLLAEMDTQGVTLPGAFGVFFYRSADPGTLDKLGHFFPVPVEDVRRDFASGHSPEAICAASVRALRRAGVRHVYVSNLPIRRAAAMLERVARAI